MRWRMWLVVVGVVGAGAWLDQITKHWADHNVAGRGLVVVIDGFFQLRYSQNPGAFFSLGASMDDSIRRTFFIVATVLALGLIANVLRRTGPAQLRLRAALVLLSAGAVGNLIDRIEKGQVTDFLHLHVGDAFHWATFNVADIYIAVGLGLLLLDTLRPQDRSPEHLAPASASRFPPIAGGTE